MIHPVSLFQAGILVAVCIQTGVTAMEESVAKPENESLYSTLGTEVMQCHDERRASFSGLFRYDLSPGLFRVYLAVCGRTLAQIAYSSNGSQFMDLGLCKTQDERLCIERNFPAEGVQSVKVPEGVTLKNGTDEFDVESITRPDNFTRQNQQNCTELAPVNNCTHPSPKSEPNCAGTVSTTVFAVVVVAAIACGLAVGVVATLQVSRIYYRKKMKRLEFYSTEREPNVNESGTALEPSMSSMHIPDAVDPEKRGDESQPTGSREPSISALTRNALGGTRSLSLPRSASCFPVLNYSGQNNLKEISTSEESQVSPREEMNQEGPALYVGSSAPAVANLDNNGQL